VNPTLRASATANPEQEALLQDRLDQLFDRIARMPDSELLIIRAVWEDGDADVRQQAWKSVRRIATARDREGLLAESQGRLAAWVNNYLTATAAEYGNFLISSGTGMDAGSVRRQALPPLLDAVAATIAAEGLSPEERDTLMAPVLSLDQHE
jgi:hypothetical protein